MPEAVNEAALAEYHPRYGDWPAFSRLIGSMASLAGNNQLIVATNREKVTGAVAYIGPG